MNIKSLLQKRFEYWLTKDLHSGWSGNDSGSCCDKCKMTNPKDPLQELVGCRDPFQINCDCKYGAYFFKNVDLPEPGAPPVNTAIGWPLSTQTALPVNFLTIWACKVFLSGV